MAESRPASAERPWVSRYDPGVPAGVQIPNGRIPDIVEASVRQWPDRAAVVFYGAHWTYGELWDLAGRFAAGLARNGLKAGDRIALYLPNCPAYPIAYLGILRLGGIVAQMSPLYLGQDLARLLQDVKPAAIVTLEILYPNLAKVATEAPVPLAVVAPLRDFYPFFPRLFVNRVLHRRGLSTAVPTGPTIRAWKDLLTPATEAPDHHAGAADQVAVLQYTGGTTGQPRAAMLTHRNLIANVTQCHAWWGTGESETPDVIFGVIPLFHIYALTTVLNYSLFYGGTIVLQTRPDVTETLKLIRKYRPTHLPGVPALYAGINNHADIGKYDLHSIRICVSGSAPLPVEVQKRFEALTGAHLIEGYGLSEASPVTHCTPLRGERRLGSIGIPFPGTDHKVVDVATGTRDLPTGEEGELVVRGPQVMLGYFDHPKDTSLALREGWLFTGDIARLDADGYAYIVDRKKDIINVGGFKVSPREIEEVLFQHPAVAEAAVVGIPDSTLGEVPYAFVVLKPGATATSDALIAFVRERLAHYKAPRGVEFRETLPRSGVQKVLRRVLRESVGTTPPAAATTRGQ